MLTKLPLVVAILDKENIFIECSDQWTEQFNKKRSDLIGSNFLTVFPCHNSELATTLNKNLKREALISGKEQITRNKKNLWFDWKVQSLTHNKVKYKYLTLKDVTRAKKLNDLIDKTGKVARIGYWELDLIENKLLWSDITKKIHEKPLSYQPSLEEGIYFYKEGKYRDLIEEKVNDAIVHGTSWDEELIITTSKGKELWVRAKGEAERVNNKTIRIFGTFQDIHKNKLEQIKFEKVNERLQLATQEAKIGIWEYDVATNTRVWDSNMYSLFGIKKNRKLSADPMGHFIHEDEREEMVEKLKLALEGKISFDFNYRILRPDGQVKHLNSKATIKRNSKGEAHTVIGTCTDITDLRTTQLQLQRNEESFVGAFESSFIGMALVDLSGNWLQVNNSICKSLGFSREELLKLSFSDITHTDDLEKGMDEMYDLIKGNQESFQLNKRYIHKKGYVVHAFLTVTRVANIEGKTSHFIAQVVDMTQMVTNKEKLGEVLKLTKEQNQSLLNFAHIVSHNLRSHSGNIAMLSDFLKKEKASKEVTELTTMLQSASLGLAETISHLNDVVQVRTTTEEKMTSTSLEKSILGTMRNIEAQINEVNPLIKMDIQKEHLVNVVPAYLDSIFLNLFTNALKYCSTKRRLEIEVTSKILNNEVIVKFRDNGLGLDLGRYGNRVFGMFKTFHDHKDAKGIGLFMTKNQIESMRGKIEVESIVDVGTLFTIRFEKA